MNFQEYQANAARTMSNLVDGDDALINYGFGLAGEAGEVVDHLKKYLFHGHRGEEYNKKLVAELGDVLWYITAIAAQFSISLEEVAAANVAKLRARYPNGFVLTNPNTYEPTPEEINEIREEVRDSRYDDDVDILDGWYESGEYGD